MFSFLCIPAFSSETVSNLEKSAPERLALQGPAEHMETCAMEGIFDDENGLIMSEGYLAKKAFGPEHASGRTIIIQFL